MENNLQQTMNQMEEQKTKSKKGLIIGMGIGVLVIIAAIVILVVVSSTPKLNKNYSMAGTWVTEEGEELVIKEEYKNNDKVRYEVSIHKGDKERSYLCLRDGNKLEWLYDRWSEEDGIYIYVKVETELKKLRNHKMVLVYNDKEYELEKK